jgi:hypothetical protein
MASLDELLSALRERREARPRELTALLRISQPTLSRLIAAAGDRICRIGRARATRYALTRSLPDLGTRLRIWEVRETGEVRSYGTLHLLAHGGHWLERVEGPGELFTGLPPFAWDMSPQGYIGRSFSTLYPELGLPARISDWNDDHRLVALARRGEDCVGNLILGDESFSRYLASVPRSVRRDEYPELARRSLTGQPGSSAGGEQPKFAVLSEGRHVLVKFAGGEPGPVTQRWKDLLVCERHALEAVRAAGIQAAAADVFDIEGTRFLEVERFDRIGTRGRRGVSSLFVLGGEYLGHMDNWTRAAQDLLGEERISAEDARTIRWLDTFGQLIGNTDRHFGNLSFFTGDGGALQLTPVYDMLPMIFAPQGTNLVERRFEPRPPSADNFDVWSDAARHALAYWDRLAGLSELADFRELCARCRDAVRECAAHFPGG